MKRLNEEHQVFQNHLREFENVLAKYGYIFVTSNYSFFEPISMESMRYEYINKVTGLSAECSFVIGDVIKDRVQVNFAMNGQKNQRFTLTDYQEDHPSVPKIETDLFVNKNFSEDVKMFFAGLEKAFEAYLHQQITGVTFENHTDKLMQAYYQQTAVYDMQKQVVEEARAKREAQITKGSLWSRIGKLFKS